MTDLFSQQILLVSLIVFGAIISTIVCALYLKICAMDRTVSFDTQSSSKSDSFAERRTSPRIHSRALLEINNGFESAASGTTMLHDISTTGACFESPLLLMPKQKIQTRMQSPDHGSTLELDAQVVWIKPGYSSHLYGVQFLHI